MSRLPSGEVYGAEVVKESGDDVYDLVRVYYHHKHTPTFRRTLFYIKGKNTLYWEKLLCLYVSGSQKTALTIIQYTFSDGTVVPIKMAPHGNSVTNKRPFYRTQSSTLDHMKDKLSDMAPKAIINETYEKAGGSLSMSSCSEVGRDLRQVYNMKAIQGTTSKLSSNCDKDLIYDLLQQHYHSAPDFVWSVSFDDGICT